MAQWQFTLDLKPFWKKDDLPPHVVAQKTAEKIKKLLPHIRKRTAEAYQDMADELENDILPMFEEIAKQENDDVEEFDEAMYCLYEWADSPLDNTWGGKKMCWVSTVI
jgi:hypothetical protein